MACPAERRVRAGAMGMQRLARLRRMRSTCQSQPMSREVRSCASMVVGALCRSRYPLFVAFGGRCHQGADTLQSEMLVSHKLPGSLASRSSRQCGRIIMATFEQCKEALQKRFKTPQDVTDFTTWMWKREVQANVEWSEAQFIQHNIECILADAHREGVIDDLGSKLGLTPERTKQRDQVGKLAKQNPGRALEMAREIRDPWYKAQALSWVARFTHQSPIRIAAEAARAASEGDNDYAKTAVRAWEVVALAENGHCAEAQKVLRDALKQSQSITPSGSRAKALMLLLHAALRITENDGQLVAKELKCACADHRHWRCKRALRNAERLMTHEWEPRAFFWDRSEE